MNFSWPSSWFNTALAKEPLNWLIVGVVATIWLMAFHCIVQGFTAMKGSGSDGQAPGSGPSPQVGQAMLSSDPTPIFTDGLEANYAQDGSLFL